MGLIVPIAVFPPWGCNNRLYAVVPIVVELPPDITCIFPEFVTESWVSIRSTSQFFTEIPVVFVFPLYTVSLAGGVVVEIPKFPFEWNLAFLSLLL